MNNLSLKPVFAAAVMAMAAIGQAQAAPGIFTIDPTAIPGTLPNIGPVTAAQPFQADNLTGFSSELLRVTGPTTVISNFGWAQFTSFNLGATTVDGITSGLSNFGGNGYKLYLTFDLSATVTSGSIGAPGSDYFLNSLNVKVYADRDFNTNFVNASIAGGGTEASINGNADDILLATSKLLPGQGTSTITGGGGVAINSTSAFSVCTGAGTADNGGIPEANPNCTSGVGAAYFAQPVPFYSLSFASFNNTGQGVTFDPVLGLIAITGAGGSADFNAAPEPGAFALAGLALLAAGAATRRARKNG